jgi:hypothetical protein
MGRIDDAIQALEATEDTTERALQLAGLISTLFKIKGVSLVVTGQLAYDSYANTSSERPEVDLAVFAGDLAPRTVLEIMRGQLFARGTLYQWTVADIPVRFHHGVVMANRELCREFTTDHGVVKILAVEEITADRILAAVYPAFDPEAHEQAHVLLMHGLAETFKMDWPVLHALCHRPEYRVGEELARMRLEAKKGVDVLGAAPDRVGETGTLPSISATPAETAPEAEAALEPPAETTSADEVNVVTTPPELPPTAGQQSEDEAVR